ncbi:uncharacterized protein LOC143291555 [Babylonia areolata]|uniref:uncharacterized protein LOC143291555 n=1 Tax=Babylonia areolata TaxID=304850 RepID=UPI003FD6AF27
MVPTSQWLIRWGSLAMIAVGTLMQTVGMASPYWIRDQARPPAYAAFLVLLKEAGGDDPALTALNNITASPSLPLLPGSGSGTVYGGAESDAGKGGRRVVRRAGADVGLWRWCVEVGLEEVGGGGGGGRVDVIRACRTPGSSEFPGWWRASQATAVVGTLMGVLACVCGGLELHYLRHGVRFSGLLVLCSVCCFVAALGIGVSHGMFGTRYMETLVSILHLPSHPSWPGVTSLYPPTLGWAFGLGAAGALLLGTIGILLLAVITRTYPTYHRAENVVV